MAHGLGLAFLGVFQDLERVGEQGAIEEPNPAVVLESRGHGHVAAGVDVRRFAPFGARFHARLVEQFREDGEVFFPSHAHKV